MWNIIKSGMHDTLKYQGKALQVLRGYREWMQVNKET